MILYRPYQSTKKIGENNPKAEQIQADNEKRMQWNREVDRAIVSNVPGAEIGQIKKEYITDRIKAFVDTFGSQPELYGSIITTAVAVLSLLVSKVLRKAAELSKKYTIQGRSRLFRQSQNRYPRPKSRNWRSKRYPAVHTLLTCRIRH